MRWRSRRCLLLCGSTILWLCIRIRIRMLPLAVLVSAILWGQGVTTSVLSAEAIHTAAVRTKSGP
jgi:hypothetical protein